MHCELIVLSRLDGSAMLTQGNTDVVAAVYGPVEVKPQKIKIDKASVEAIYRPKSGLPTCEMDSKTKVKEEVNLLEDEISFEKVFSSSNPERIFENDTTTSQCDFKMNHEIYFKEEIDILKPGLPNESVCFSTDFGNRYKNDIATFSDFELHNNTESKEWAFVSDTGFQKEEKCFSSDLVKKIKKEFITDENGEVSVQRMSTETECQSEPLDSNIFLQSENKDRKAGDLESPDSYRLIVDTSCSETPGVDATFLSEMGKNVYSHRSKKNIENGKTCISGLPSKKQVLITDAGIQNEIFGKIFPGNSALIHECKKPCKCNVCSKPFTQLSDLQRHSLIHEGKKLHKYNVCSKPFLQLSDLKRHSLIHEGKKPHQCNVCNKSFTTVGNLKMHSLIHDGKKPHKCNVCNKSFIQLANLKRHILIHEGKKPHKCNVCNKSFTQLGTLKGHSFIHEGKKPYKCNVCSKPFTWLSGLKRHSLIHEGKKTTQM